MKTLLLSLFSSTVVVLGALGGLYLSASAPQPSLAPAPQLKLPLVAVSSATPVSDNVIQLEPLRIVGRASAAKLRPRAARPELVPCSEWRPIGPVYAQRAEEPVRQRHVQLLCSPE